MILGDLYKNQRSLNLFTVTEDSIHKYVLNEVKFFELRSLSISVR